MNKRTPKKLTLCTETLRNLTDQDLQHVAGGTVKNSVCPACTATNIWPCL